MHAPIAFTLYLIPLHILYAYSLTLPNLPASNDWSTNSSNLDNSNLNLNSLLGLNDNAPNATLTSSRIPPDFNVSKPISRPNLKITSMIFNIVDAMKRMAVQDFFQVLHDPEQFCLQGYIDFGIGITPYGGPGQRLERRFVIWGMMLGVIEMYRLKKYQQTEITLLWKKVPVGTVDFLPLEAPSLMASSKGGGNGTLASQEQIAAKNPTNLLLPTTPKALHTTYAPFPLAGSKLDIFHIFITLVRALAQLASSPNDKHVSEYRHISPEYNTGIVIRSSRAHEGVQVPFLQYEWIILALGDLLVYMKASGRFGAVKMTLQVGGQVVGG